MPDVLIVDDDPDIRAMLSFLLGTSGFAVREACDGDEALRLLADRAPDCMVLDVMMPKLDGFSVLEAMRETHLAADTRVVILSAKGDERSLVRGWELGADEYLIKPVDPDQLANKLLSLVGEGPADQ
jgi:two-component system, OmpR family, response regulator